MVCVAIYQDISRIHIQLNIGTCRNIHSSVYIHGLVYTHMFPCCQMRRTTNNGNSIMCAHLAPRFRCLILFFNKQKWVFLEKGRILEAEQEICRMSLEDHEMPENKGVLCECMNMCTHTQTHTYTIYWSTSKRNKNPLKEFQWSKRKQSE